MPGVGRAAPVCTILSVRGRVRHGLTKRAKHRNNAGSLAI